MPYRINEVDGETHADEIRRFNSLTPEIFPLLKPNHLTDGFWWFAYLEDAPIAFAGLVAMTPFENYGYLKRCYVSPDHHGHGLQFRLMTAREIKAKQLGWTHLVSECAAGNRPSAGNFAKAGFSRCDPEQCWGAADSIYWIKKL